MRGPARWRRNGTACRCDLLAVKDIFDIRWFAREPALFLAGGDTLSALARVSALEKLSYPPMAPPTGTGVRNG